MARGLYTYVATALVAGALASAGAWRVQEWRWQANTAAVEKQREAVEEQARELRDADARQQRQMADRKVGEHAVALAGLNTQLGDARAHIAKLSDRRCLDAGSVGMLNAIGTPAAPGLGLRTPAGDAAGASATVARPGDDDNAGASAYASERDTADQIAACRARYAEVSGQLNQILDIEDARDARRTAP